MHHTQGLAARELFRILPWQAEGRRNMGRCGVGGRRLTLILLDLSMLANWFKAGPPMLKSTHPTAGRASVAMMPQAVVTSCKLCDLGGSLCIARRQHSCCCCAPRRHPDNLLLQDHEKPLHLGTTSGLLAMISPRIESSIKTGIEALASLKGISSTNFSLLLHRHARCPVTSVKLILRGRGWVVQTAVHSPSPEHRCWAEAWDCSI